MFTYFKELCRDLKVQSNQDIFSSSLWFNTHIGTDKLFSPDWFKHGIHIVGDIININSNILSLLEVKNRYNFPVNFLNYFAIKKLVQKFLDTYQQNNIFNFENPYIPFHIKTLITKEYGHKLMYSQLQQTLNKISKSEIKWCLELHIEERKDLWKSVYKICFYAIPDDDYIRFQYRVLHWILGVTELLVKMKISECNRCRLCDQSAESIIHLFSECTISNTLWNNVICWIESRISIKLHLDRVSKTIGYL